MDARFMWVFVGAYGLLGLAGLIYPDAERKFIGWFTGRLPVRILGLILMAAGIFIFRYAKDTGWPILAQVLGVVNTVAGGVNLILPDAMIVLNEAWIERRDVWHRLLGALYVVVAYLCYLATIVPVAEIVEAP